MRKILIFAAFILVGAGAFLAYKMYNQKHTDLSKVKADYEMSAVDLFNEFSLDEQSTNSKYLNKIIEVKGNVSKVEESAEGTKQVYVKSEDLMFGIICDMEYQQDISNLKEDSQIIIRGECTGYLMDVALNRCVLVQ